MMRMLMSGDNDQSGDHLVMLTMMLQGWCNAIYHDEDDSDDDDADDDDDDDDDDDTQDRHTQGVSSQDSGTQDGRSPGPPRIAPFIKKIIRNIT